ncbi:unnamed protein product [Rhodiola kirilowii]
MTSAKSTALPLGGHFVMSKDNCPKTELERLKMASVPYDIVVGSVMYLMLCTRPDLAFAISLLSRFMSLPGELHWSAMKYLLRYIASTRCFGLSYGLNESKHDLCGFVDSDYASNRDNRKSTPGFSSCGLVIAYRGSRSFNQWLLSPLRRQSSSLPLRLRKRPYDFKV